MLTAFKVNNKKLIPAGLELTWSECTSLKNIFKILNRMFTVLSLKIDVLIQNLNRILANKNKNVYFENLKYKQ